MNNRGKRRIDYQNNFERFDERDTVFARRDLQPGTPEYEGFYYRHPQWKVADDRLREQAYIGARTAPADLGMFFAPAWFLRGIGEPRFVDGEPATKQVKLSPDRAALKVKTFAQRLGADTVGISPMNPAFAYTHRGRIFYPEEPWGAKIEVPHRFAISIGIRENIDLVRAGPHTGEMLESGLIYAKTAVVSVILAAYIRSLGYPARAHHFRNYQTLSVPLAVQAGLGELGRCGFLLTKRFGNCLRLATVTTDLPLEIDNPIDIGVQDFCERCKLCAEACPSKAIPIGGKTKVRGTLKWMLDPLKCYRFWHEAKTDCGICIASCPWTEPDNILHRASAEAASRWKLAQRFLLWIYPIVYGKFRPKSPPDWLDPKV